MQQQFVVPGYLGAGSGLSPIATGAGAGLSLVSSSSKGGRASHGGAITCDVCNCHV